MAGANVRPAAGGGRWVDVDPERLPAWLNRFAVNHGGYRVLAPDEPAQAEPVEPGQVEPGRTDVLRIEAADGTTLSLWPPPGAARHREQPPVADIEVFIAEAQRPRRIGLLLARQASVAVGIAEGPHLIASKVDTYYVQSRTAAGGWSQQRYARRRVNQARAAAESAAEHAVRLLQPEIDRLAAIVPGGDRRTVDAILADPRLAPLRPLVADRFLAVGEPRRRTLEEAARLARQVRILVRDPQPGGDSQPDS